MNTKKNMPGFDQEPASSLLDPGRDSGLSLLRPAPIFWQKVPGGKIDALSISDHPEIKSRWEKELRFIKNRHLFHDRVEFASAPAMVENLLVKGNCLQVSGKWFLGGPSAERLIIKYRRAWQRKNTADNSPGRNQWSKQMTRFINECRAGAAPIPHHDVGTAGLDFVVEAKNLQNYFHFTKEVLNTLTMIEEIPDFDGRIVIVFEKNEPAPFVMGFIEALFPELSDRVVFRKAPFRADRALITWYGDYAFLQRHEDAEEMWGSSHIFTKKYDASVYKVLRRNGYSRALRKLRERAYSKIQSHGSDHLPKRVWISRRAGKSHDRTVAAEPEIVNALRAREFEVVYFEDLNPINQIRLISHAEIVVGFHGAGLTNMLYAKPGAHIIEIGTLQSVLQRQSDFVAFSHCSQANYTTLVADFDHAGQELIPPLRGNGLYPVRISKSGISKFLGHIDTLIAK